MSDRTNKIADNTDKEDDVTKLILYRLRHYYVAVPEIEKSSKLNELLGSLEFNQVVIFTKDFEQATVLNKMINSPELPSMCIHPGISQQERIESYRQFKSYSARVMIVADEVGRGVNIEFVDIVINYDTPSDTDAYLYRFGRAGKFGIEGLAITFVSSAEDKKVVESVQERFEVSIAELPAEINP
ncbi:hypothetical protein BX070DRAFT_223893 [Coemansia spiralis]|nr:hypothetical protein BX070DRAFT_223893 [Coemansia spiralis]